MHWCSRYIGIPYSVLNCAELVAEVLEHEFDRKATARYLRGLPEHDQDTRARSHAIMGGWPCVAEKTDTPSDGDGVILKVGSRLAHMGLIASTPKGMYVLHTVGNRGSVIEPINNIMTCTVEGFYKWK